MLDDINNPIGAIITAHVSKVSAEETTTTTTTNQVVEEQQQEDYKEEEQAEQQRQEEVEEEEEEEAEEAEEIEEEEGDYEHDGYDEFYDLDEYFDYWYEDSPFLCRPGEAQEDEDDEDEDDEDHELSCVPLHKIALSEYVVAGRNLGYFYHPNSQNMQAVTDDEAPPFELYEDFDLSHILQDPRNDILDWRQMLVIRQNLQRPNLSWYVDKVARKRWLAQRGYPQAKQYYLMYADEILESSSMVDDDTLSLLLTPTNTETQKKYKKMVLSKEIQMNLPKDHGYCAKVSHMVSLLLGGRQKHYSAFTVS